MQAVPPSLSLRRQGVQSGPLLQLVYFCFQGLRQHGDIYDDTGLLI